MVLWPVAQPRVKAAPSPLPPSPHPGKRGGTRGAGRPCLQALGPLPPLFSTPPYPQQSFANPPELDQWTLFGGWGGGAGGGNKKQK